VTLFGDNGLGRAPVFNFGDLEPPTGAVDVEEIPLFGTDDKLVRTREAGGLERWTEVQVTASGCKALIDWSGYFRDGKEALAWLKTIA
jgi:hypothetical protein